MSPAKSRSGVPAVAQGAAAAPPPPAGVLLLAPAQNGRPAVVLLLAPAQGGLPDPAAAAGIPLPATAADTPAAAPGSLPHPFAAAPRASQGQAQPAGSRKRKVSDAPAAQRGNQASGPGWCLLRLTAANLKNKRIYLKSKALADLHWGPSNKKRKVLTDYTTVNGEPKVDQPVTAGMLTQDGVNLGVRAACHNLT